ncbi:FAD-dependent oxidoreductase [Parathalassolituus penaei]|uniref:FAD-dependent oxidoreductase n=1 Tax=Parathalassolituus penaei TaxID=2997323 RepID=A0A9X3EAM3_9GAMM|nr:FAD-dependent oxidoreductase [Parathalassolituus penaei]MCY0964038.1 FAD-dependent oxidoreductase [Parathalassolituus penaei]
MSVVSNVLVIGGGFSGMTAAICLQKAGIAVDLIEIDPDWCPLGAGISINGSTLRALQQMGLYEQFREQGWVSSGVDLYTPTGQHIARLPTPQPVGSDVAGGGGILRPVLAKILSEATLAAGVNVRLGSSYQDLELLDNGVRVTFEDGEQRVYDLVVGADGVHSQLRGRFFPEVVPPQYIGQGVWRAVLPRPAHIERPTIWTAEHIKIGVNPVSATQMYLFITEDRPTHEFIEPSTWADVCAGLLRPFPDPLLQSMIPHLYQPGANIDYRPLGNLLVPTPWNRGRLVMIGDTVAATTPHLASGAGIGIESGMVLAQELVNATDLQSALDAFHQRRWSRCELVVKNSERLCHIEINGGDKAEHARIMAASMAALAQPI